MACFTLTPSQRSWLSACINVGFEGVDTMSDEDSDAIAAIIEELEASDAPIEITVTKIEEPMTHADYVDQRNGITPHEIQLTTSGAGVGKSIFHDIPGATDALLKSGAS